MKEIKVKRPCTTLTISGSTQHLRDQLKALGFRWHRTRRNWYKFGEVSDFEALYQLGLRLAQENLGNVIFDCFTNEEKINNLPTDFPF